MAKFDFLIRVLSGYVARQDKACPHCGEASQLIGRKYLILELRRCNVCNLMFRWPKDNVAFNQSFYQSRYVEKGLTTELPSLADLKELLVKKFTGSEKDYSEKISVVKALLQGGKILDFGCSWGYATHQLKEAGYDAEGFEISKPRAQFGRVNLGVNIFDDYQVLDKVPEGSYDAIFTSHVLEHLPDMRGIFDRFHRLLRAGGYLFIFVPNCGGSKAQELGTKWGPMVCEKHPQALDAKFFETALPAYGFAVTTWSTPYEPCAIARKLIGKETIEANLGGDELLVCATKLERS